MFSFDDRLFTLFYPVQYTNTQTKFTSKCIRIVSKDWAGKDVDVDDNHEWDPEVAMGSVARCGDTRVIPSTYPVHDAENVVPRGNLAPADLALSIDLYMVATTTHVQLRIMLQRYLSVGN